ncbi:TetR/AcrR family transcriptional regulator [Mycolicibacterium boenickei]|uniref:TetR-family transcriptional regulator n=1 Tax=Mycolicibacterium boenickei TaxID=146017 RepID=A0AAX2ZYF1_9MYCO|nr:TetR/AcrR family transcriptional regulator [Mycolicibacterium boenickei]PEG56890.1 TetR/AcrR family transcriptional regulator [Mycolicibacterium boenickei]UNC00150.1 TetR/AcrR family transcriptional regulator [Mycolicibacterium boenickei]BBX89863.1 putative TetR-family transcriptional regulator [Mycolicibacterium boenickei]
MTGSPDTAAKPRNKRGSTRARMLGSAVEVLRERGAAGVTIDEVLTRSGAPRGSVYHHFPGGRRQILTEALQFAANTIGGIIGAESSDSAWDLVHRFIEFWERVLTGSDFTAGCPVVAVAIAAPDEEPELAAAAAAIFDRWRAALTAAFSADGFDESDASSLAVMCIATLEGAVVLCRSSRSVDPLHDVARQLEFLIKSREFVRRNGVPGVSRPVP